MVFHITSKPPVLFGKGAIKRTGVKAKEFGWASVICIYDKGVKAAGIVDQVLDSLKTAGVSYMEYDGVLPDPPDYIVEEAAEVARKAKVDGVVGIGGGSSLDVAKCVNILLTNPSPINQYWGMNFGLNPVKGTILIPTTAGTGSEVTNAAIITDTKLNIKVGVAGEFCLSKLAIVDPSLTLNLPVVLTAQTAIDAFAHGFEAYTSLQSNLMSDLLAEKTMQLVVKNLPLVLKDPMNYQAREALSFAAMLGGMAFTDSLVHLGHCIGQAIGAVTHIAHGTSCGLGIITVIEYLADAIPEKLRRVGEILNLELVKDLSDEELGKQVAAGFKAFCQSVGLPTALSEAGISETLLETIANLVSTDPVLQVFAPKKVDAAQALALLKKAY